MRKWLAWEASQKNVMIRDFIRGDLCNIAKWNLAMIIFVGLLGMLIKFGRKYTNTAILLKTESNSTDPCE